jgi:hypothetical protein
MSNSYVLLEKVVVGSAGASSVTFANIPQTGYTDLVVKVCARTTRTGTDVDDELQVTFNGSTSGYSTRMIEGNGSTTRSVANSGSYLGRGTLPTDNATASTFGNTEYYIPNYAGSANKSVSIDSTMENNATTSLMLMTAGLWANTAAITSISFTALGPFDANSTFYLYGVAKLGTTPTIAPKATGGDVIMTDGTYWYHQFNSSGTFTPAVALTCDYLVVAGGAGGASDAGGGGGAGGLRSTVTATGGGGSLETALSLGTSTYTVTVGAGGATGSSGNNSVFSTITSTAGGAGGTYNTNGTNGGSGGGAGWFDGATRSGGTGTANQGYAGGVNATGVGSSGAGGGGGANAVGGNGSSPNGGAGGNGVATSITGSSVTYAGGGGGGGNNTVPGTGGAGGSGGGGGGQGGSTAAVSGTANRGAGGGGGRAGGGGAAAAGGSGVVVVRYLVA